MGLWKCAYIVETSAINLSREPTMRQIYTSPRVENVERVVAMLGEAGIATSVTNRRSWAGHDFRRPSYSARQDSAEWPQVWVVHAEDQPRARALLREAGVEPATRHAEELARSRQSAAAPGRRRSLAIYLRLTLLAVIAILVLLHWSGIL
jgi:hypothetical protein